MQKRTCKRFNRASNSWDLIKLKDLVPGDVFQLYEPNGDLVHYSSNYIYWIARTHAYYNKESKVWTVNCDATDSVYSEILDVAGY